MVHRGCGLGINMENKEQRIRSKEQKAKIKD